MNEAWTRTSHDRWSATRDTLIENLAASHPNLDVTVYLGGMPCGFFIFNESTGRHDHVTPAYVRWCLGDKVFLDRVQL